MSGPKAWGAVSTTTDTRPVLRPGEYWEAGAMCAQECIAEVVERADYHWIKTLAGWLPLREWLQRHGARHDWPMVFRDGFTSAQGPALCSAFLCGGWHDTQRQYASVFPLARVKPEGAL